MSFRSFVEVQTDDGSVTLQERRQGQVQTFQNMHSLKGALSETAYVYGVPFSALLEQVSDAPLACVSVGLGIGYVEMCLTALFLKQKGTPLFLLFSCENNEVMRQSFLSWLAEEENTFQVRAGDTQAATVVGRGAKRDGEQRVHETYTSEPSEDATTANNSGSLSIDLFALRDKALGCVAKHYGLDGVSLKSELKRKFKMSEFLLFKDIHELLNKCTWWKERTTDFRMLICYDAFSVQYDPEMWTIEAIIPLLHLAKSPFCSRASFVTYASNSRLKKILKEADFRILAREGFRGKRECTWATRE